MLLSEKGPTKVRERSEKVDKHKPATQELSHFAQACNPKGGGLQRRSVVKEEVIKEEHCCEKGSEKGSRNVPRRFRERSGKGQGKAREMIKKTIF